ncbi:MAG: DNA-3-methyladenine glycosylase 2 family protein [Wenzhouxiangellaceae bacterium]|nr:DNA-3-methyladenine glycosylase 2 family protein [Wenzhouxiangellaceae bacterium]
MNFELNFELTSAHLRTALDDLAGRDRHIAAALQRVGYPSERRAGRPNFEQLLRIIAGQQLSVRAAATIFDRLEKAMGGKCVPERLLLLSQTELRALGLSRQKIGYARGLAEAVMSGTLMPESLTELPDEQVVDRLTALKGFGRWSAEMFLLFSLGRPDVWPADDLGIQVGLQKLKNMRARPDRKKTDAVARRWRPYRGAAAIFVWHVHANTPMQGRPEARFPGPQ